MLGGGGISACGLGECDEWEEGFLWLWVSALMSGKR
jgi:hypothetical protein